MRVCVCVFSVPRLEALLGPSEQLVCELSKALDHSEQQLGQLQDHAHAQTQQLLQLRDTCTQLSTAREMNEVRSSGANASVCPVCGFLVAKKTKHRHVDILCYSGTTAAQKGCAGELTMGLKFHLQVFVEVSFCEIMFHGGRNGEVVLEF